MGWHGYPGKSRQAALREHLSDLDIIERTGITREGGYDGHLWLLVRGHQTGNPVILQVIIDGVMFKDVDESMGPLSYDVPVNWLDKAPLAPGPFAKEFREKVYGYWAEKEREAGERERLLAKHLEENPEALSTGEEHQGYGDSSKVPF